MNLKIFSLRLVTIFLFVLVFFAFCNFGYMFLIDYSSRRFWTIGMFAIWYSASFTAWYNLKDWWEKKR